MRIAFQHGTAGSHDRVGRNCRGVALAECLVYCGLFFMVVFLSFMAYDRTHDTSRQLQKNADEIAASLHVGERWREDIRQAVKEPVIENDSIQIQQKSGEVRYVFRGGAVFRETSSAKASARVLSGVKNSRMMKDAGKTVASWRWEIELNTKEKTPRTKPLFTFQAVAALVAK